MDPKALKVEVDTLGKTLIKATTTLVETQEELMRVQTELERVENDAFTLAWLYLSALSPHDKRELKDAGLPDEIISEREVEHLPASEKEAHEIVEVLCRVLGHELGS